MNRLLREAFGGLFVAIITLYTVVGGIGLAFSETGGGFPAPTVLAILTPPPPSPTFVFVIPPTVPPRETETGGGGETPIPTPCVPMPPADWLPITLGPDDTLASLASRTGTNAQAIAQVNCLSSDAVFAGAILYLPPVAPTPPVLPTAIPCGPPPGWVFYTVQAGDTLLNLSVRYGTTIYAIQRANCLAGTQINAGQKIFMPPAAAIPPTVFVPTATPTLTPPPLPNPTATEVAPVFTATSIPPSETPVSPTLTASPSPASPTETNTVTLAPETATPTETASPISTLAPSDTAVSEATATETPTTTSP